MKTPPKNYRFPLRLVFQNSLGDIRGECELVSITPDAIINVVMAKNKTLTYFEEIGKVISPAEKKVVMRKIGEAIKNYTEAGLEAHWVIG